MSNPIAVSYDPQAPFGDVFLGPEALGWAGEVSEKMGGGVMDVEG